MRPLYETQENLKNEAEAKAKLEKMWDVELKKMPISYYIDFAVISKETQLIIGWAEYRRRAFVWGLYDTIMLSYNKFIHAKMLCAVKDLKCKFIVETDDGIYSADLTDPNLKFELKYAGRTINVRDAADQEPTIFIDRSCFIRLI